MSPPVIMGPPGLEPGTLSACTGSELQKTRDQPGAESGAVRAESQSYNPDLAAVVTAWPTLPEAVTAGILALVQASGPK